MKKIVALLLLHFLAGCGTSENTEKKEAETTENTDTINDNPEDTLNIPQSDSVLQEIYKGLGLELFSNIEQIPFCIYLPLKYYKLNEKLSDERAKFVFINQKFEFPDPELYIQVQGMFRSDESTSLEEYFENTYAEEEAEAQGKIIKEKHLVTDKSCFWAMGYWANFPHREFLEITWLRQEEVVVFYMQYHPIKEIKSDLDLLRDINIERGVNCE